MSDAVWVVRAGVKAQFAGEFLAGGYVAVGFQDIARDDLSSLDEESLRARATDPGRRNAAGQLVTFALRMSAGDFVITPRLPASQDYLVGVVGPYEHHADDPPSGPHRRPVRWLGTFPRQDLTPAAINTLGAIQTIFRPTAVEAELRALMTRTSSPDGTTTLPNPLGVPSAAASIAPGVEPDKDGVPVRSLTTDARPNTHLVRASLDVTVDEVGRATLLCHHPALVMSQVPRHVDPGREWDGAPGVYVLTGTDLEHAVVRTGVERSLTATSIVKPWAYVGLSEDFRGRLSSHRQNKPEWRRALLVRSAAQPFASDDLRYLELAIHQALEATDEVVLAQTTPRGNLSAQPRSTMLLDACAGTVVAVLRLTGTLI